MVLQDHFRPPLSVRRHWHALHNAWATYLASDLNQRLPQGYFAEANVQFGIEIDVAAFEEPGQDLTAPSEEWIPPEPACTFPFAIIPDLVEVLVFSDEGGPTLAGAVELVSPSNKDRAAHRDALVTKCVAYLQQGVGLILVDVVTERRANLHEELLGRLQAPAAAALKADLYAVSYRPVSLDGQTNLQVWPAALAVGQPFPTLPFGLRGGLCLPLNLGETYERTCREQRVTVAGT